jgi:protoheme IX farnesyltransferase
MIKTYYLLTKPGILFGNLVTTAGAFILASRGHIDYLLFLATAAGLFFVIASACVFNNYIDMEADGKMARTKNRPLVTGLISTKKAIYFAIIMGIIGVAILALYTNLAALSAALVGYFVYVVLYSFWKYKTTYATLVGSVSGAIPPVVGYCAASHTVDAGAILLFAILVLWQMPHFFSIAMFRAHDYEAASIPVMPVQKGNYITKIHILLYILAFMFASYLLTAFGFVGNWYLIIATIISLVWLSLSILGFKAKNDKVWARQMFIVSLFVIMTLSFMMSVDGTKSLAAAEKQSGQEQPLR